MATGIVRDSCNVAIRFLERRDTARACGLAGPAEQPEGTKDEPDSRISNGFSARGGGVAVEDPPLGEGGGIDPVEAGAGTSEDFTGGREEGDEFLVPVAHLAAGIPEGAVHGGEGAEFVGFEGGDELGAAH